VPTTQGQGNPDWTFEETILALDLLQRHAFHVPGKSHDDVAELSSVLQSLPIHAEADRLPRFRNVDGVYLKLQNLISRHPSRGGRAGLRSSATDREIWDTYWQSAPEVHGLAEVIKMGASIVAHAELEQDDDDDARVSEGRLITAMHKRRERAPGLRGKVIARERKSGLACKACDRAPILTTHGAQAEAAMYEVHHVRPLSDLGPTATRLSDLVLLCATCHRLLHYLIRLKRSSCSVDDLRETMRGGAASADLEGLRGYPPRRQMM
jgi:5-methylcytosine-specific restriction enzyme A